MHAPAAARGVGIAGRQRSLRWRPAPLRAARRASWRGTGSTQLPSRRQGEAPAQRGSSDNRRQTRPRVRQDGYAKKDKGEPPQQRLGPPRTQPSLSPAGQRAAPTEYQHTFFVTCHPGLEEVVADELRELNIEAVEPGRAGVTFRTNAMDDAYRANLWLRCAIRVLHQLGEGPLSARGDKYKELYGVVRGSGVDWHELIPKGASITIEPRASRTSGITSSRLVWQAVKDAVADAVHDARGERLQPPPDGRGGDVPLFAVAHNDRLTLLRDMSGDSLHKRGYRAGMHRSPLNEAAAAGLLRLAGWHKLSRDGAEAVLADPMCGSGTLLIEAAMAAHNMAPGLCRAGSTGTADGAPTFAFVRWPDLDAKAWQRAVEEAQAARRERWGGRLYGNDIHQGALQLALRDVRAAGTTGCTRLHAGDCATWHLPEVPALVVTNPPWGIRLMPSPEPAPDARWGRQEGGARGERDAQDVGGDVGVEPADASQLEACWRGLGTFLRAECPDAEAMVLSGNRDALNWLRMRPHAKAKLTIGGVQAFAHLHHVLPPKSQCMKDERSV